MPNTCSFLQPVRRWMMAAAAVLLFVMIAASGSFGGRENPLTAYAETSPGLLSEKAAVTGLKENTQVTKAKIQFEFIDPQSLREGQSLAGDTLVKGVRMRSEVREEKKEAVEQAKKEISQIEKEREAAFAKRSVTTGEMSAEGGHAISASVHCSEQDYELLKRIVQAEAGVCDTKGRILVANVIMNRVRSEEFPDTISEVVYQKSQFSPVDDGRLYSCEVTQETVEAVDRALAGEDYSQGALYFMNRSRSRSHNVSWFDRNLTYLFQHDKHEFFR